MRDRIGKKPVLVAVPKNAKEWHYRALFVECLASYGRTMVLYSVRMPKVSLSVSPWFHPQVPLNQSCGDAVSYAHV